MPDCHHEGPGECRACAAMRMSHRINQLSAEVERLTRERDEARTEVERLRAIVAAADRHCYFGTDETMAALNDVLVGKSHKDGESER